MPLYIGEQPIAGVYRGSAPIARVYRGSTLVFDGTAAAAVTYGTMAEADAGNNGFSVSQHGLQFTNIFAGTVTHARIGAGQGGQAWIAAIYTNNAGSPGVQVGGDSSATAGAIGDLSMTWSSNAPVLAAGVTYWLVCRRTSSTELMKTCVQVTGIVTGAANAATSISGQSNVTAGRDLRIGCTVTP